MKYFKTFLLSLFLFPTLSYSVTYTTYSYLYQEGDPDPYCTSRFDVTAPSSVQRGASFVISADAIGSAGSCPDRHGDFDRIQGRSTSNPPNLNAAWVLFNSTIGSFDSETVTTPLVGNFEFGMEIESRTFYTNLFDSQDVWYTVTVSDILPVCSDSINNDGQQGADTLDPECHTDCNVNNAGSYTPNHNSETTPPNGTCPTPPTLELNARAAFFQVVKNFIAFITTKAFAGE